MISRFGDTRTIWIYGILAVLVLAGGLQGAGKINIVTDWARLLPGFNETIPEGTSIVGVNLETNDLMYFTGEKWRKIEIPKDKDAGFVMGSYEFKPDELNKEIFNFYILTERKPDSFNIDVNGWRYWIVSPRILYDPLGISPKFKKKFGSDLVNHDFWSAEFKYDNSIEYYSNYKNKEQKPNLLKIDIENNPELINTVVAWRDSILEGNNCEKFLPLMIKEKGITSSEPPKYTVRKIDNYLFVDLSKSVSEGAVEKWKDGCFEIKSYVDSGKILSENEASVEFRLLKGYNIYYYKGYWSHDVLVSKYTTQVKYLQGFSGKNLYEGLMLLTDLNKGIFKDKEVGFNCKFDDSKIVIDNKELDLIGMFKCQRWSSWNNHPTPEQISKLVYKVLDEYNRHLSAPVSANSEKVIN